MLLHIRKQLPVICHNGLVAVVTGIPEKQLMTCVGTPLMMVSVVVSSRGPTDLPYSRKYWRSINLAVWPPRRYVVILAEFKFGGLSTTSHRRLCIANRQIFRLYSMLHGQACITAMCYLPCFTAIRLDKCKLESPVCPSWVSGVLEVAASPPWCSIQQSTNAQSNKLD